ncbi:mitochondrial dynamin GTPase Msp1 [Tilletia horrida]|uniref:dynamin GTPase n=1 Tax=Tilletia horrida TaxID=155126 RepID=A0AAN6JMT2_9BASI|nr:mitochondrial dynamin GTPase Msp1 [Tilletia horrida]KAK0566594.1 mitochondrial dynamin GTPase Msp1 [Tilletia horrida]
MSAALVVAARRGLPRSAATATTAAAAAPSASASAATASMASPATRAPSALLYRRMSMSAAPFVTGSAASVRVPRHLSFPHGADQALAHGRTLQVRPISFSSVPRVAFRVLRVPAYAGGAAAGVFAYANYKVDEFRGFMGEKLGKTGDALIDAYDSVNRMGSKAYASAQLNLERLQEQFEELELPEIKAPAFFRNFVDRVKERVSQSGNEEEATGDEGGGPGGGSDGGSGGGGAGGPVAALAASFFGSSGEVEQPTEENEETRAPANSSEELMMLTRKLIEVRNILKEIDHEDENLTLPSIVVIGSQSSGKSSVLEAIVGHEFLPKGNNMVTRRPIELTLIHTDMEPAPASGRGRGKSGKVVEYGEFPGLGMGRITDFKQIQKVLFDLNMAVPESECVSDEPIELRIHSPHVPDLTLIDLPGYVQISSIDQPEQLRDKIEKLCEKYIQPPNVILAVCAADVDLANSPALRASRKVDQLGLRTIGVITKMDLVDPEVGAGILTNNRYPLALGYVGVVCKHRPSRSDFGHDEDADGNITGAILRQEKDYFDANRHHFRAPTRGRNAGVEPMLGTDTLRRRLMSVLEESMGSSLHGIANAVQVELEEASYQFKVQYNDRAISAESYLAETMDALKLRFKEFADNFGKPQVRSLLKDALDQRVMDILAQMYWDEPRVGELAQLADQRRVTPEDLDRFWQYKLDASTSGLTKAGVGRLSTQIVVDELRTRLEGLAQTEPLNHHPDAQERIMAYGTAILRDRFGLTADQVENCVKPFKYEVEVEPREWEAGREKSLALFERELKMCDEALGGIRKAVGGRRLRGAVEYVSYLEDRAKRRAQARLRGAATAEEEEQREKEEANDLRRPDYNPALLNEAKRAMDLSLRSNVLRMRIAALKSRRCKAGPEQKAFCPEAFMNVVADKLTYTAVMFINIEMLTEFFYQFPREIDTRLVQGMEKTDLAKFARENPSVRAHLDLQERKEKLEMVMDKLDSLVKLYQERQAPRRESKWSIF